MPSMSTMNDPYHPHFTISVLTFELRFELVKCKFEKKNILCLFINIFWVQFTIYIFFILMVSKIETNL